MATRKLPDTETLRKLLDYDPATGALTWRAREVGPTVGQRRGGGCWNRRYAGTPALACIGAQGYPVGNLNGSRVTAHRVIWKLVTGEDPEQIDHINGDRTDNRFSNLRPCTHAENTRNLGVRRDNTSGCAGVYRVRERWEVRVGHLKVGIFDSKTDAIAARKAAERRLGYHPNHGSRPSHDTRLRSQP